MLSIQRNKGGSAWKAPKYGIDYYEKDSYYQRHNTSGTWYGKGAQELGLEGGVQENDFLNVLYGNDKDGNKLLRNSGKEDRRSYIDLTFSAPKSVSLVAVYDKEIEKMHQRSVEKALDEIEKYYIISRRGKDGFIFERTDNICTANFIHHESRENDPEIHTHSLLMNQTKCADGNYRTIEASEIFTMKMYLGMAYRNNFVKELQENRYRTKITDREQGYFEIEGVSEELISEYSKRSKQIAETRKINTELYDKYDISEYEKKQMACIDSRKYKSENSIEESRKVASEIHKEHAEEFSTLKDDKALYKEPQLSKKECIEKACEDVTENNSTFRKEQVILQAMKHGMGDYTTDELKEEYHNNGAILKLGEADIKVGKTVTSDIEIYTTQEIQDIEQSIFNKCEDRIGKSDVSVDYNYIRQHFENIKKEGTTLSEEQKHAIDNICSSKDQYSVIQGDAGVGKTFALNHAREILENQDIKVRGFSPTGKTVRELESGSGISSQTVDSYLEQCRNKPAEKESERIQKEIWIIDEAGMLSSRKFKNLLDESEKQHAKCVFVGDVKQFKPIEQGKMFEDLYKKSTIQKSEITEVRRQKSGYMKSVVRDLSEKNRSSTKVEHAFSTLDKNGRITSSGDRGTRLSSVSKEYLSDRRNGIESYVLSSTNRDKNEVNTIVRDTLTETGEVEIGARYSTFQNTSMSGIKQRLVDNYRENQVVFFQNNAGEFKKGTQAEIVRKDSDQNTLTLKYWDKEKSSYKESNLDVSQHGQKLQVFNVVDKNFGTGDRIIFQKNDKRIGMSNGDIGIIKTVEKDGNATIALTTKNKDGTQKKIECNISNKGDNAYNYLDHAYSITQYKSQGATFDKSIINHSSNHRTNYNAMYVSVTRAKHDVSIYTNNKKLMIDQALVEQSKGSTLDFTKPQKHYNRLKNQRNQFEKELKFAGKQVEKKQTDRSIDR